MRAAHQNMVEFGVVHEAWAPFTEGQNDIFNNPVLVEVGAKYGKSAGQVVLRGLLQQDVVVIPKTVHRNRMEEKFDVFDFELDAQDMAAFEVLDDGTLPRIFDHFDINTITWLLGEFVKKQQLQGGVLY